MSLTLRSTFVSIVSLACLAGCGDGDGDPCSQQETYVGATYASYLSVVDIVYDDETGMLVIDWSRVRGAAVGTEVWRVVR